MAARRAVQRATTDDVRIVLADDHEVVRAGLRLLLEAEPGFEVVAEAGDVEGAVRYTPRPQARGARPRPQHARRARRRSRRSRTSRRPRRPRTSSSSRCRTTRPSPAARCRPARSGYVLKEAADDELIEAVHRAVRRRLVPQPAPGRRARLAAPQLAARRADRARDRGPAADRARPHERRDRRAAPPLGAHGRVPPRPHPAEAAPHHARRARALRARPRPREVAARAHGRVWSRRMSSVSVDPSRIRTIPDPGEPVPRVNWPTILLLRRRRDGLRHEHGARAHRHLAVVAERHPQRDRRLRPLHRQPRGEPPLGVLATARSTRGSAGSRRRSSPRTPASACGASSTCSTTASRTTPTAATRTTTPTAARAGPSRCAG